MEQREIIEGNKLIAEFMGAKTGNGGTEKHPVYTGVPVIHSGQTQTWTFSSKDLEYHNSWNWLMPVVEKIESTTQEPKDEFYHALNHYKHNNLNIFDLGITATIATVYKYAVEYIKWYNLNQH